MSSTAHLTRKVTSSSAGSGFLSRPKTSIPTTRRTQELWKRTTPGIMEQFIYTPISTMHDHFKLDETLADPKTQ
eukprot:scaffold51655_cov29-Prasinocladus_malaysianus.AAC.1